MMVRFTPAGRAQFIAVMVHLRDENPAAARRFLDRSTKALQRLRRFPRSGRAVPEFPELPYREVVVAPFRIFYRPAKDAVWIVGVWHGAQQPGRPG